MWMLQCWYSTKVAHWQPGCLLHGDPATPRLVFSFETPESEENSDGVETLPVSVFIPTPDNVSTLRIVTGSAALPSFSATSCRVESDCFRQLFLYTSRSAANGRRTLGDERLTSYSVSAGRGNIRPCVTHQSPICTDDLCVFHQVSWFEHRSDLQSALYPFSSRLTSATFTR